MPFNQRHVLTQQLFNAPVKMASLFFPKAHVHYPIRKYQIWTDTTRFFTKLLIKEVSFSYQFLKSTYNFSRLTVSSYNPSGSVCRLLLESSL